MPEKNLISTFFFLNMLEKYDMEKKKKGPTKTFQLILNRDTQEPGSVKETAERPWHARNTPENNRLGLLIVHIRDKNYSNEQSSECSIDSPIPTI